MCHIIPQPILYNIFYESVVKQDGPRRAVFHYGYYYDVISHEFHRYKNNILTLLLTNSHILYFSCLRLQEENRYA